MKIRTFRDLIVWNKGMDLARLVYKLTRAMPAEERFALTSQMRRAASSIPMNIAEGFGQRTRPQFLKGLRLANGSLLELMTACELAISMGLMPESEQLRELLAEQDRILSSLIRTLENPAKARPKK
jgi:four helix bundle protein